MSFVSIVLAQVWLAASAGTPGEVDCAQIKAGTSFRRLVGTCKSGLNLRGVVFPGPVEIAATWESGGELDLRDIQVAGGLTFTRGGRGPITIKLDYASISGSLRVYPPSESPHYPKTAGKCERKDPPQGQSVSITASYARIGGALELEMVEVERLTADHISVGGVVALDRSVFKNPVNLNHMNAAALSAVSASFSQRIDLGWAEIGGNVDFNCTQLDAGTEQAVVNLIGATIHGIAQLYRISVPGRAAATAPAAAPDTNKAEASRKAPTLFLEGHLLSARVLALNGACVDYALALGNARLKELVLHGGEQDACTTLGKLSAGTIAQAEISEFSDSDLLLEASIAPSRTFALAKSAALGVKPTDAPTGADHPRWSPDPRVWLRLSKVLEATGNHTAADQARSQHSTLLSLSQLAPSTYLLLLLVVLACLAGACPTLELAKRVTANPAVKFFYAIGLFVDLLLPDVFDLGLRERAKEDLKSLSAHYALLLSLVRLTGLVLTLLAARYLFLLSS